MNLIQKIVTMFAVGLANIYVRILKHHHFTVKDKIPHHKSFIILCNHASFFDFLYVLRILYPQHVRFMVARKFYYNPAMKYFLKIGGCFPKSLFQPDFSAIRKTTEILKHGGIVGLFPEGQIPMHGISTYISPGTGRYLKLCGVPVYTVVTKGAYHANPIWAKTERKGRIDSCFSLLFSEEDVKKLSADELEKKAIARLNFNPYVWLDESKRIFKGRRNAEGLQTILYRCPLCKKEDGFITRDNSLICNYCGEVFSVDSSLNVTHEELKTNVGNLYNEQRDIEIANFRKGGYTLTAPAEFSTFVGPLIQKAGKGIITLDEKGLRYVGTIHEHPVDNFYTLKDVQFFPYDPDDDFHLYDKNKLCAFHPDDKKLCAKFALACEALYTIRQERENNERL